MKEKTHPHQDITHYYENELKRTHTIIKKIINRHINKPSLNTLERTELQYAIQTLGEIAYNTQILPQEVQTSITVEPTDTEKTKELLEELSKNMQKKYGHYTIVTPNNNTQEDTQHTFTDTLERLKKHPTLKAKRTTWNNTHYIYYNQHKYTEHKIKDQTRINQSYKPTPQDMTNDDWILITPKKE